MTKYDIVSTLKNNTKYENYIHHEFSWYNFIIVREAYSKYILFTILMRVGHDNRSAHIQILVRLVLHLRTQMLDIRYDLDLMMAPGHAIK